MALVQRRCPRLLEAATTSCGHDHLSCKGMAPTSSAPEERVCSNYLGFS